jgi:hypothetical protein
VIGFKCECGYSIEAEGDPSEVFAEIDDHEQFCPMNEISSEHPAKNRFGADREQSNTLQGVEMSENKTTAHSTFDPREVERLRSVRAALVDSRNGLVTTYNQRAAEAGQPEDADRARLRVTAMEILQEQIDEQSKLINTYDWKINKALAGRDYPILKDAGWFEAENSDDPDRAGLMGPSVAEDSTTATNGALAWDEELGTFVIVDTALNGGLMTLGQAQQFARRLLTFTTWVQRELEQTKFNPEQIDKSVWAPVEPVWPVMSEDNVTTFRISADLPHGGRVEIDLDPRDGERSPGWVDLVGAQEMPGIEALEATAVALLDFAQVVRNAGSAR